MRHCYEHEGVRRMVIGSGGSAFVDGGLGAMIGLGLFKLKNPDLTY
jgi:glycerate kinase